MHASVVRLSTAAAAVLALTAVAACSSSAKGGSASKSSTPVSSTSSVAGSANDAGALPSGVTNAIGVPTSVANVVALRKDVTMTSCKATADGWGASGVATNAGTSAHNFAVTVFFTTDHATVIGFGAAHVNVAAGGKQSWTVSGKFHAASPTLCVLRGVG
jgi:hypothetical protein